MLTLPDGQRTLQQSINGKMVWVLEQVPKGLQSLGEQEAPRSSYYSTVQDGPLLACWLIFLTVQIKLGLNVSLLQGGIGNHVLYSFDCLISVSICLGCQNFMTCLVTFVHYANSRVSVQGFCKRGFEPLKPTLKWSLMIIIMVMMISDSIKTIYFLIEINI